MDRPRNLPCSNRLLSEAAQAMALTEQLIKQSTALTNQAHAFGQLPSQSTSAQQVLTLLIEGLNQQIDRLEESITVKIKDHDGSVSNKITSIQGIVPKTASVLMVLAKGVLAFDTYRQLISYIGLAPRIYHSGISIK